MSSPYSKPDLLHEERIGYLCNKSLGVHSVSPPLGYYSFKECWLGWDVKKN